MLTNTEFAELRQLVTNKLLTLADFQFTCTYCGNEQFVTVLGYSAVKLCPQCGKGNWIDIIAILPREN